MNKRRHTEEEFQEEQMTEMSKQSFYEYVLNSSRLLLKEEFEKTFSSSFSYSKYFESYYKIHLKELLVKKYNKSPWISEMDLVREEEISDCFMEFRDFISSFHGSMALDSSNLDNLLKKDLFEIDAKNDNGFSLIVIKNIGTEESIRKAVQKIEKLSSVKKWYVSQHGIKDQFLRSIFVQIETETVPSVKEALAPFFSSSSLFSLGALPKNDLSCVREVGKQFCDKHVMRSSETQCKKILRSISALYRMPEISETLETLESRVSSEEVGDLYILALRKIFNYCFYCKEKFSNSYELLTCCGALHVRNSQKIDMMIPKAVIRSSGFYALNRMSLFQEMKQEIDPTTFCNEPEKTDEYMCRYCGKKFTSLEFFEKHLNRRLHPEYEAYTKLHAEFFSVIFSLKYPVIEIIEQKGSSIPLDAYQRKEVIEKKPETLISYSGLLKKYPVLKTGPIYIVEE
ncbi:hypothetical protein NEFER03_1588 [Nematocida sp. LUAm3]|nr:hypothetical protein NEFER03_1588 [Nematocida sp. LUAm3]KAI5176381.1 hypothetical protein NEFER02_2155 [Nematocida sp. LUAm2]KAI5179041.1 hypothetical protein NEFER01_1917 [Nematocida sp. LUAm1]